MWFKQVTCDCCYRPLASIGRHNRFYFCKILEFQKVSPAEFGMRYAYFNNPNEPRINYDTSRFCANGYVYSYKTEPLRASSYSTWFCSRECAIKAAIRSNSILFYYDEEEDSVAFIPPHLVEIDCAIGETENVPLLMKELPEGLWLQKRSDYRDLSVYGLETKYPEFSTKICNVVKPNASLFENYKKLVLDSDFEKSFWGSNNSSLKSHIQNQFAAFLPSVDINFGRRMMIEWFITDKLNQFIGFIHLTQMYPAFPYKWVVEFGLVKEYRGKGIMKVILGGILDWAKRNGCDEVYAISEEFNLASHALLNKLPYAVKETWAMMSDEFGGERKMRIFVVTLK